MARWSAKTKLIPNRTDSALKLTLWQIEIKLEEARALASKVHEADSSLSKTKVYKIEIGLKMHRSIELLYKILLGIRVKNTEWSFYGENKTHSLTLLHDKLEMQKPDVTDRLGQIFQKTVMVNGDPKFGKFALPQIIPLYLKSRDVTGMSVTFYQSEEITVPSATSLRRHLVQYRRELHLQPILSR